MRVRADHETGAAIDEMAEALLLAGGFRMEIEDDGVGLFLQRRGVENGFGCLERVVEFRVHEHAAHDIGDQHAGAVAGVIKARAAPWRARGVIRRAQELIVALAENDRFLLVPDMVAGGDDIGAGIDGFEEDILGDAEAAGGILAVDDDEIEFQVGHEPRQAIPYRSPSRLADHVTQKKQPHSLSNHFRNEIESALGQNRVKTDIMRLSRY